MEPDFIVTELLSELKLENERKASRIKQLSIAIVALSLATLVSLSATFSILVTFFYR